MKQIRLQQWWLPKAGSLIGLVYLYMALSGIRFPESLFAFAASIATIAGIAAFGYIVNDWTDIGPDRRAGKSNRLAGLGVPTRLLLLLGSIAVALLPWLYLPLTRETGILIAIQFGLFLTYSLPPIRIKERSVLGLLWDGLYAQAAPALLAAYTLWLLGPDKPEFRWLMIAVFAWQLFSGLHNILLHQLDDHENDLKSGSRTFVVRYGPAFTARLLNGFIIPLEWLLFFVFCGTIVFFEGMSWYAAVPVILLLDQLGPVFMVRPMSYFKRATGVSERQQLNLQYHKALPWIHLIPLIVLDWRNALFLLLHALLFRGSFFSYNGISTLLARMMVFPIKWWPAQLLKVFPRFWSFIRLLASWSVNYPIYWFRRIVLRMDDVQARGGDYEAHQARQAERNYEPVRLAIFNKNKDKYTETFVRGHLEHLPFEKELFYGAYLPDRFADDHPVLGNTDEHKDWIEAYRKMVGWPEGHFGKQALKGRLVEGGYNVALAEFGTTGAHVYPLCKELGIPLLVIFYGYDASRKTTTDELAEAYAGLFHYADRIIGVSTEMLDDLHKLGAPREKLVHLACYVNTGIFQYADCSANSPHFLAIGRFAETKSPHLTILAFYEVLKSHPDARLTMIGRGGGGELFEACLILVRALGIEDSVDFPGRMKPEEIAEFMHGCCAFIQHSLTTPEEGDKEGTPVAIMEAMASGMPVVATRHAGIKDVIVHEENGLLVDEFDHMDMARQMNRLLEDRTFAAQLGKRASEHIHSNLGHEQHMARLAAMIKAVHEQSKQN